MAVAMQYSESFSVHHQPPASLALLPPSRSCVTISSSLQTSNVKIGGLWKRSQGVSRFTKSNYKHRVFILTDQALSYYGGTVDRVGQLKGRVSLDTVRAVEFVEISAFNLAHTMQVTYHSKKSGFLTLYITATTKEECADWVVTLRQVCYFNRDMLMHYHPGALSKNKWTCCKQAGRMTLGCQPTYHLLTRSSSRYAQMRRRDTLTNSSNRQCRSHSRSCSHHNSLDRQSAVVMAPASSTDAEGVVMTDDMVGSPGQCLSNSCMELSAHPPPHNREMFGTRKSRRSSQNSAEHSVGMGSVALNKVSLSEINTSEMGEEEGEGEEWGREGLDWQSETPSHVSSKPGVRSDSGAKRSQVAPACALKDSNSGGRQRRKNNYQVGHRTLPRSFKTSSRQDSARNSSNLEGLSPLHYRVRSDPVGEEEPRPIPPPRAKKGSSGHTHTRTPSSTEHTSSSSSSPMSTDHKKRRRPHLKHSNTFIVQDKKLGEKGCNYSQSMGTLNKATIQPKISSSNPNVIHV